MSLVIAAIAQAPRRRRHSPSYRKWDAVYLVQSDALAPERMAGVETGGYPHKAIREDASINLAAIAEMRARFPDLDSSSSSRAATTLRRHFFRPSSPTSPSTSSMWRLATRSRAKAVVINKIDLAPYVGASLDVMDRDARRMRGGLAAPWGACSYSGLLSGTSGRLTNPSHLLPFGLVTAVEKRLTNGCTGQMSHVLNLRRRDSAP